jgi:hypothetical protein
VINALKASGFSKEQRAGLHRLRELYNSIKHEPLFVPGIKDLLEAVRDAAPILQIVYSGALAARGPRRIGDGFAETKHTDGIPGGATSFAHRTSNTNHSQ